MILSNFKSINKKLYKKMLLLSPFILIIYISYININYNMMDMYSFFDKLTPYDIYYLLINDPLIELTINVPILLLLLIGIINSKDYFIISRFYSRVKFADYKIRELIYINLFVCIFYMLTIYIISYLLTSRFNFDLYSYKGPISIVFNKGKTINRNIMINGLSFIIINFYLLFMRNLAISLIILIISRYINLVFSFMVSILPFMISAWMNSWLVHFFILEVKEIHSTSRLLVKLISMVALYVFLKTIYIYTEERKV